MVTDFKSEGGWEEIDIVLILIVMEDGHWLYTHVEEILWQQES